jgi:outer membrane protein assembly factor BamB
MYGHDPSRTSYNPGEKALTLATVGRLAPRFHVFVGMGAVPSSSGPVVGHGRVCVGSSVDDGENYHCFAADTGAPAWSADLGHDTRPGGVGIGSTAAMNDSLLVVGGGDAAYYGLDLGSGAILWRSPMDAGPGAFAWSSPLLAGGLAYVGISDAYDGVRGELRALSLADGSVLARQYFVPEGARGADIWNSPAASPDGARLAVATGNDLGDYSGPYTRSLVVLDRDLGILESHQEAQPGQDLDFATTPVFFHDSAGRSLVGANEKDGTFYAYAVGHVRDGAVWQRPTGTSVGTLPAYDPDLGPGGTLFIVGDNGLLFGVDPGTGQDRWPPLAVGLANGNLAVANGLVYMGAGGGVAVVDAATGALLRVLTPADPGPTYSGVAVAGGLVYWMSGPYLDAWGIS